MFAQTDRRHGQGTLCRQGCRPRHAAQVRYCKITRRRYQHTNNKGSQSLRALYRSLYDMFRLVSNVVAKIVIFDGQSLVVCNGSRTGCVGTHNLIVIVR